MYIKSCEVYKITKDLIWKTYALQSGLQLSILVYNQLSNLTTAIVPKVTNSLQQNTKTSTKNYFFQNFFLTCCLLSLQTFEMAHIPTELIFYTMIISLLKEN